MGFGNWLRQTFLWMTGMSHRPHRLSAAARLNRRREKRRAERIEIDLRNARTDRDENKAMVVKLERLIRDAEEIKHEQSVEIRKLQGDLEVQEAQVERQADALVYYETVVKAATARASIDIAKATQGKGGNLDAQFFSSRD